MLNKPAVTGPPIHDLLASRWSPRAFDAAKGVSRDQALALVEAARWAPSCFGDEPWRVIVWDRMRDPASWKKAFDCLAEGSQVWERFSTIPQGKYPSNSLYCFLSTNLTVMPNNCCISTGFKAQPFALTKLYRLWP